MSEHPKYPKLTIQQRAARAKIQIMARQSHGEFMAQVRTMHGWRNPDEIGCVAMELLAQAAFLMSVNDVPLNPTVEQHSRAELLYLQFGDALALADIGLEFYNVVPIIDGEAFHQEYGVSSLHDLCARPDRAAVEIKVASMLLPCVATCDPRELIQRIFQMYGR
ncbi:MAG: hypothetical protein NT003_04250 [Candidatus Magasanikbacteria bacterium]|nr:hypothetical protein [Candidatus Magasanikbacteria bacterium]